MSVFATGQPDVKRPETRGGSPVPEDLVLDDLKDLMETVTATSKQLQQTHVVLQREVGRLQRELAEANAQLQRSRSLAALGGMAAGIAHEIRNPLASIQLYVQMIAEDVQDRPEQKELCRKVDRAIGSLDAIVRDVLQFSREVGLAARPTSTGTLFSRTLESCAALFVKDDIDVNMDAVEDRALVADETLLAQALGNLIRNAVESMTEGEDASEGRAVRQLRLSSRRQTVRGPDGRSGPRIVLGVEDTGPGMPDHVVERMFNPFFTTRATGTGLGLAIVHRIVDAHGGHINVQRIEPHGTRIELCLREAPPSDGAAPGSSVNGCDHAETDMELFTRSPEMEHGR